MTSHIKAGSALPASEGARLNSSSALFIGSIGVVYGDIGTSPLYAFREAVNAAAGSGAAVSPANVIGVLSLILWALIVVVTLKYVLILLRADNNGEGGTLALMALANRAFGKANGSIIVLGIIGAALFYGDAILTPALSVLSAVEGIKIATTAFDRYVVPVTVVILVALFALQGRGTARIATFFGPIMVLWFTVIGLAAIPHVVSAPQVLEAINPVHAISFVSHNGMIGLIALGAVFLAVTGAEALYADLGHFGRKPIQRAWVFLVLPSLALNYLGQGALVLADPAAIENPFFRMYPSWALLPMVALATIATVIASQAVITGAYSLTQQAVQLGLLPRFEIRHTSGEHAGQIYMPRVNFILLAGVLLLVLVFRSSSSLASAYGIAVTGTMVVTAIMAFVVIWKVWRWPPLVTALLIAPFLFIDLVFLFANLLKVHDGGWVPLVFGAMIMVVMRTWMQGSALLFDKTRKLETPLADLARSLDGRSPSRVPGTAIFLTSDPDSAPTSLLHSLKHYKVLHERNVVLTVETLQMPYVPELERVQIEEVSPTFTRVALRFGFLETPNVPKALLVARRLGWQFDVMSTSFFVSRRALKPAPHSFMPRWQDRLFIGLSRSANDATEYFQIPTGRVVEVGTQVTI